MRLVIAGLIYCVAISCLLASDATAQSPGPAVPATDDGPAIYRRACATCHGVDGRGPDRAQVTFEDAVPDFTDCNFSSREPIQDWVSIAHQGGPLRAFSRMMPAFGSALRYEELDRVIRYIKSFCGDKRWPSGELNLPRALVTEKAFPEDEWVIESEGAGGATASVGHKLIYERRIGRQTQIEAAFPFGYSRVATPTGGHRWVSGVGDMILGVKQVLTHGLESGHIVSASAEWRFATGNRADGFGTGANAVEGFLTFGKLLPSEAFIQAQAGAERSLTRGAETGMFWRALLGRTFVPDRWGRAWSPMVEALGSREGQESVMWDVAPQLHVTLSRRGHVSLTVGPRIPVSGNGRQTTWLLNFLWDTFDGGLREGW